MAPVSELLTAVYLLVLSWVVYRSRWFAISGIPRPIILCAFYLKIVAGVIFWAIYTYHYSIDHGSDAFAYFEEGARLHAVFKEDPAAFFRLLFALNPSDPELLAYISEMDRWNRAVSYGVLNDNPSIIKFNALVMFLSGGYYHIHTLFMAFVSFSGLILLLRFFEGIFPGIRPIWLLMSVILPPSLLFWGSGVMKEGLLIFGIGLLFYALRRITDKQDFKAWFLIFLSVFLLTFTKAYVLIAFLPAVTYYLFMQFTGTRRWALKFVLLHALLFAFVFTLGFWIYDYNVFHMLQLKQKDFYNLAQISEAGSLIQIPPLEHWTDVIINAPVAIFNTYFRPHLFEADRPTLLFSAAENALYVIFTLGALLSIRKLNKQQAILVLTCISCITGLGMLVGLVTPVLGAVVRYKIPALPFLVILCLIFLEPRVTSLTSHLKKRLL